MSSSDVTFLDSTMLSGDGVSRVAIAGSKSIAFVAVSARHSDRTHGPEIRWLKQIPKTDVLEYSCLHHYDGQGYCD